MTQVAKLDFLLVRPIISFCVTVISCLVSYGHIIRDLPIIMLHNLAWCCLCVGVWFFKWICSKKVNVLSRSVSYLIFCVCKL